MPKFKRPPRITQLFLENANPAYTTMGLGGHPGIDYTNGYGSQVKFDNSGYVYKVYKPSDLRSTGFVGVYQLVPVLGDTFVEVCYGHMSKVFVGTGYFPEGYVLGLEGNLGEIIYSGGERITIDQQLSGDKRGSHVHIQYRPVIKSAVATKDHDYLTDGSGKLYNDGSYYQVIHRNSVAGCVDPLRYEHTNTFSENLAMVSENVSFLLTRFKK